jgi:hypothetical protein
MFSLRELDNRLALKLGDVVTQNGAGQLFDLEQRINYISRAYGRLIRTLKHLMGNYSPSFANTTNYVKEQLNVNSEYWGYFNFDTKKIYIEKVLESYIIYEDKKYPIINIENNKWLSTVNGKNDLHTPNFNKGIIYGTIMNNTYYVVPLYDPGMPHYVEMLYNGSPKYFDKDDLDTPVNISSEYLDMLLTLAAAEGMADAARTDKFQMFVSDFNNQITSIAGYINLQIQLEGKHSGK